MSIFKQIQNEVAIFYSNHLITNKKYIQTIVCVISNNLLNSGNKSNHKY